MLLVDENYFQTCVYILINTVFICNSYHGKLIYYSTLNNILIINLIPFFSAVMESVLENKKFNPYDYEGSPAVDVVHGYLAMLFGLVLFSVVNYLAILIGPSKKMKGDTWRWRNTLVSWIHADIMGVGVLYWYVNKTIQL